MSHKWSVLIVDDEPRARALIRKMFARAGDFEIAKECSNGYEAIDAQKTTPADLMFLDIQMPELDGFAVLRQMKGEPLPAIVFVTAYDQYALKAFEVHALDYLLKPFDEDRFLATLQRARAQLMQRDASGSDARILSLLREMKGSPEYLERFAVRSGGRIVLVGVNDVEWIQAEDKYVRLHTSTGSHLIRDTLARLQEALDPRRFVRVHRSALVKIDSVQEIQPDFHGDYQIMLTGGAKVALGRSYRDKFFGLIESDR